jgi:trans-AT polyketide synthase/acyltransferase/oxidoreductase domain-containing protein/rhizoxin biosynthesis acyltransferase
MLALMFPGQGSQRAGMGAGLFDLEEYRGVESAVDALLGYSPRAVCQEEGNRLSDTRYTQPCLYLVNALHYLRFRRDGRAAQYVVGHSLGEYNALHAAGVFDLLTGLRIVHKRAELMSRAPPGTMAAVLGLAASQVVDVLVGNGLDSIDIANYNAPSQIVVSGPVADIDRALPLFEAAGARLCVPLAVSGAFHSRYMESAARSFAEFLAQVTFVPPAIPVLSNVTGKPFPRDPSSAVVTSLLARQMVRPVQWVQIVRQLAQFQVTEFRESGPGNVLTRLVSQIREAA